MRNSPLDLLILPELVFRWWICTQYLHQGWPRYASDWAISLVWWGKALSMPPQWMSRCSPRYFMEIQEHSMCQPG